MMYGKIVAYDGESLIIKAPFSESWLLEKQHVSDVEITLLDGRTISADQRKKAYALMRDIALYTGFTPAELKEIMKYSFIEETGINEFSLSDCDMTTARFFISFLIEFCLVWDVPCQDSLIELADDIGRYLYLCLVHKKCCICGRKAEVHHADGYRVGMGRDRKEIAHVGLKAYAVCRKHHNEAHTMPQSDFNTKYHIFPVTIDEVIAEKNSLRKKAKHA